MKILLDLNGEFNGNPLLSIAPYIGESLAQLSKDDDSCLMYGVNWLYRKNIKAEYGHYKRRCYIIICSPSECMEIGYPSLKQYDFFTDVYCNCPFTCGFMNKIFGYRKFKYIPTPFTNKTIKSFGKYDATCCYFGCLHSDEHASAIDVIRKYKYKFITSKSNSAIFHPYEFANPYPTHVQLTNEQKLIEVSGSKSNLVFNKIYIYPHQKNLIVNRYFNQIKHKAYSHFEEGIIPQFKIRTMEVASCKSLILCKNDPWNLINDFFVNGEEYISFDNISELREILEDIENNFEKYKPIIEKAWTKQKNYTIEKIVDYILKNDDNLVSWSLKNINE